MNHAFFRLFGIAPKSRASAFLAFLAHRQEALETARGLTLDPSVRGAKLTSKLFNTILFRKMVKHVLKHVFRFERCCAAFIFQTNKVGDIFQPSSNLGSTIKVNMSHIARTLRQLVH